MFELRGVSYSSVHSICTLFLRLLFLTFVVLISEPNEFDVSGYRSGKLAVNFSCKSTELKC